MALRKPKNCADCGKPINADNPLVSGGGNLSYSGKWTSWALGKCCRKSLTDKDVKAFLTAVFKQTAHAQK